MQEKSSFVCDIAIRNETAEEANPHDHELCHLQFGKRLLASVEIDICHLR